MSEQPEALRLADELETMLAHGYSSASATKDAAAELRRLYEENKELREANEAFGKRQDWWCERMWALEQQRNELLEALKGLVGWFDDDRMNGAEKQIKKARAAIAKGEQA